MSKKHPERLPCHPERSEGSSFTKFTVVMRNLKYIAIFVAVLACASFAQLVLPKKAAEDSVSVSSTQPMVLVDTLPDIRALDDSISTINAEPTLQETAKTMAIKKGFEILGETLKNSLAPNSAETEAVIKEMEYR